MPPIRPKIPQRGVPTKGAKMLHIAAVPRRPEEKQVSLVDLVISADFVHMMLSCHKSPI